jgi:hypothetical protein
MTGERAGFSFCFRCFHVARTLPGAGVFANYDTDGANDSIFLEFSAKWFPFLEFTESPATDF